MSWLYSQVLVEEYLGDISLDGEQSVQLSGSSTPQAYCAPDKMTGFSRLSRFGMTFKPLTEDLGEELLMSYRAGFHAKTSQPQEKVQESMETEAECGHTWRGWLAKYDPDMSLWRTAQCSLLEDLNESLETLPKSGMTRNGLLWERPMLAHPIKETVFGFSVPTPVSSDATSGAVIGKNDIFYTTSTGMPRKVNQKGSDGSVGLGRLVQMWPTTIKKHLLPTPDASQRGPTKDYNPKAKSQSGRTLQSYAAKFPTPQASDNRDRGNMSNPSVQRRIAIGKQISLSQSVHPTSGQLNPTWVEWLMGWPLGWTDLKPLATDKSPYVPQPHGES